MSPLVIDLTARAFRFETFGNRMCPQFSPRGMEIHRSDHKVAAFFGSNSTAAATKLLTFAHVNLPAAGFYCLHGDILEGSFCAS